MSLLQVLGRRGAVNVKTERNKRGPHIGITLCGPAKGPMLPLLFTFAGKKAAQNYVAGTLTARFQQTPNGWPDATSWLIFANQFVAHMKQQKLKKALLFVDNAETHSLLCALELFIANNVHVVGFIPNASGFQQPCDLDGFGKIKPATEAEARKENILLSQTNIAKYFEKACRRMAASPSGIAAGGSIIAGGFKSAGLVPWNPSVFDDKTFAPSDARLGLHKDHPEVKKAALVMPANLGLLFKAAVADVLPESAAKLAKVASKQAKLKQIDPTRIVMTSEQYVKQAIKKDEDAEQAAAAKSQRAEERKAKKIAAEAKKVEVAKRKAERAAVGQQPRKKAKAVAGGGVERSNAGSGSASVGGAVARAENPYAKPNAGVKRRKLENL